MDANIKELISRYHNRSIILYVLCFCSDQNITYSTGSNSQHIVCWPCKQQENCDISFSVAVFQSFSFMNGEKPKVATDDYVTLSFPIVFLSDSNTLVILGFSRKLRWAFHHRRPIWISPEHVVLMQFSTLVTALWKKERQMVIIVTTIYFFR